MSTLLELVERVRDRLDDFGGDVADSLWKTDDSDCLWSNTELARYLADAEDELCRRVPLRESRTASCCAINVRAGESRYRLHPRVLSVERVVNAATGGPLEKLFIDELDANVRGYATTQLPLVAWYEDTLTRDLTVKATPTESGVLKLVVHRLPLCRLSWDAPEAEPEVNPRYEDDLVNWAVSLAYQKNDAETLDLKRSAHFAERFDGRVGPRMDANRERIAKDLSGRRARVTAYYR